jgi:general secretion pathway protein G
MELVQHQSICRSRHGFTLLELVVVVVILGILVAVAAPRMFNTTTDAKRSAAKQSLTVIRGAIELYEADNGRPPPAATLAIALKKYLQGPFPPCPVGNVNAAVFASSADPIVVGGAGQGWAYNETTGEFAVNHADGISW